MTDRKVTGKVRKNSIVEDVNRDSKVVESRQSSHLQKHSLKHHHGDGGLVAHGKSYISWSCSHILLPTATKAVVKKNFKMWGKWCTETKKEMM